LSLSKKCQQKIINHYFSHATAWHLQILSELGDPASSLPADALAKAGAG